MVIQDDNIARIDVENGVGCTIRPKDYKGTKIVVNERISIEISLSSRMEFKLEDWYTIENLINKCIKYMINVKNVGAYPDEVYVGIKTIPASSQKDLALYRDEKGRGIFIVGEASILSDAYGKTCNRSGAKYIRGVIEDASCIQSVDIIGGNTINITTNGRRYMRFDTYATKPTKLVQEIWSAPAENMVYKINIITVNNNMQCMFRR